MVILQTSRSEGQKRHCTPSRMTFRPWIEFASGNRVSLSLILGKTSRYPCIVRATTHTVIELTSITIISLTPSLLSCFPAGLDYFCPSNRRRPRWMSLPFQLGHSSIDGGESRERALSGVKSPNTAADSRAPPQVTSFPDAHDGRCNNCQKRECGGRGGLCRIVHN